MGIIRFMFFFFFVVSMKVFACVKENILMLGTPTRDNTKKKKNSHEMAVWMAKKASALVMKNNPAK